MKKIKIAISSCLLGHNVRYDGGNKYININQYFNSGDYELQALCPEVAMGLSIPRHPIQIQQQKSLHLRQVEYPYLDYTQQMIQWFDKNCESFNQYAGFILKSKSPSCGYRTTPHHLEKQQPILGDGFFVHLLRKYNSRIPIIDEISLMDSITRSNFIEKIIHSTI